MSLKLFEYIFCILVLELLDQLVDLLPERVLNALVLLIPLPGLLQLLPLVCLLLLELNHLAHADEHLQLLLLRSTLERFALVALGSQLQ